MKKILIVEDSMLYINIYTEALAGKAELLIAETVEEAIRLFNENTDVAVVVMDGCLNRNSVFDTHKVIKHIRACGYTGHIIANSSGNNRPLVNSGCNKVCTYGDKNLIPTQLTVLLGL